MNLLQPCAIFVAVFGVVLLVLNGRRLTAIQALALGAAAGVTVTVMIAFLFAGMALLLHPEEALR